MPCQRDRQCDIMESVGLGKLLPGAVNDGGCTFSQGYYENRAFIVSLTNTSTLWLLLSVLFQVYASGPNVIILTEQLEWVQTLSSASFGYSNVRTNCVHCAALGGKVSSVENKQTISYQFDLQIAAGWGSNVTIFQPTSTDSIGKVVIDSIP